MEIRKAEFEAIAKDLELRRLFLISQSTLELGKRPSQDGLLSIANELGYKTISIEEFKIFRALTVSSLCRKIFEVFNVSKSEVCREAMVSLPSLSRILALTENGLGSYSPSLSTLQRLFIYARNKFSFEQNRSWIFEQEKSLAVSWVTNSLISDPTQLEKLEKLLEEVIVQLNQSNSLSQIPELDALRRENLINTLNTIIRMLKAPKIETTILSEAQDELGAIGKALKDEAIGQSAKKGVSGGLWALGQILSRLKDYLPSM